MILRLFTGRPLAAIFYWIFSTISKVAPIFIGIVGRSERRRDKRFRIFELIYDSYLLFLGSRRWFRDIWFIIAERHGVSLLWFNQKQRFMNLLFHVLLKMAFLHLGPLVYDLLPTCLMNFVLFIRCSLLLFLFSHILWRNFHSLRYLWFKHLWLFSKLHIFLAKMM